MIAFIQQREKKEISCAKDEDLCDNGFNLGGLAIWEESGKWKGMINLRLKPPQRSADRDISLFSGFQKGQYKWRSLLLRSTREWDAVRLYNSWVAYRV
jgi:hypothetical protein